MKQFEVTFEGEMPGPPERVWDAFTARTRGWLWDIAYEPRVGGAEKGLTTAGGKVTAWDPHRRFATRAERPDGWFNQLEYELEPRDGIGSFLRYRHTSAITDDAEYELELDACRRHTAFDCHSLGEYLRHFAGRDATYVAVDAPDASAQPGSFARLQAALGLPAGAIAGDPVRLSGPEPLAGVIDYRTPEYLGIRTQDALYRIFGRDAFGWPIGVAVHSFADGEGAERAWRMWLDDIFSGRREAR